jgi:hypothetical protein
VRIFLETERLLLRRFAVLALDLFAGRRLAAVDETHDLEVVVECE